MTKKKTYVEAALSDVRKGQKLVRDAVTRLADKISSQEKRIKFLEEQCDSAKEYQEEQKNKYENLLNELVGGNVDGYLEGYRFEQFVVRWMDINHKKYGLKIWQGDKHVKIFKGTKTLSASWNKFPDLIFVNEKEKKVVALECKYRYDGILKLTKAKFTDYQNFEKQINSFMQVDTKTYLMVGISGESKSPAYMYCIPIDHLENLMNNDDEIELNMRDFPQFKVMEKDYYDYISIPNNFQF